MIGFFAIISFISFLFIIIALLLIILNKLNYIKILKISPAKMLLVCIIVFIVARAGNFYFIQKNITATENNINKVISSGNSTDPIVVSAKNFYVDDDNTIHCDISIKNNTNYVLENVEYTITHDYYKVDGGVDKHLNTGYKYPIGYNSTTPFNTIYIEANDTDIKYEIHNLKKVSFDYCIIKIDGKEQQLFMDDLKKLVKQ